MEREAPKNRWKDLLKKRGKELIERTTLNSELRSLLYQEDVLEDSEYQEMVISLYIN